MDYTFDEISALPDEATQYAARPRKSYKHLTYLTTRVFRTPGLTPVLPFHDSKPDQNATPRPESLHASAKRTKRCFHAKVAPMPLRETDLYPAIRSPEELAAIAEIFCVVNAPTHAGNRLDQQENGNGEGSGNGDDINPQMKKKSNGLSKQVRKFGRRCSALMKGEKKTKVKPFNADDVDTPRKRSLVSRLLKK